MNADGKGLPEPGRLRRAETADVLPKCSGQRNPVDAEFVISMVNSLFATGLLPSRRCDSTDVAPGGPASWD